MNFFFTFVTIEYLYTHLARLIITISWCCCMQRTHPNVSNIKNFGIVYFVVGKPRLNYNTSCTVVYKVKFFGADLLIEINARQWNTTLIKYCIWRAITFEFFLLYRVMVNNFTLYLKYGSTLFNWAKKIYRVRWTSAHFPYEEIQVFFAPDPNKHMMVT